MSLYDQTKVEQWKTLLHHYKVKDDLFRKVLSKCLKKYLLIYQEKRNLPKKEVLLVELSKKINVKGMGEITIGNMEGARWTSEIKDHHIDGIALMFIELSVPVAVFEEFCSSLNPGHNERRNSGIKQNFLTHKTGQSLFYFAMGVFLTVLVSSLFKILNTAPKLIDPPPANLSETDMQNLLNNEWYYKVTISAEGVTVYGGSQVYGGVVSFNQNKGNLHLSGRLTWKIDANGKCIEVPPGKAWHSSVAAVENNKLIYHYNIIHKGKMVSGFSLYTIDRNTEKEIDKFSGSFHRLTAPITEGDAFISRSENEWPCLEG